VDYQVVYDLSNGNVGHMSTIAETLSLSSLRQANSVLQSKLKANGLSSSSLFSFNPEVDNLLKESVFASIVQSIAGLDDESLIASCILPNIGVFHYSYAWYVCKAHFQGNLFQFHVAFMNLSRLGYYDYLGSNYYVISKYYLPESTFQYRNYFVATGELTPGAPINPSPSAIRYPFNSSVVLQMQWDFYYEYWSKELIRMNDLAMVSPQVLDYFPIIYPHFRAVFGNFNLFPRVTLSNPRNPMKKMMVYIDAYDKFKNKSTQAAKAESSGNTAPAASADAPVVVNDASKLKTSKLGDLSIMLAGAVGRVLSRYYPTVAGQLIAASILEAIDVEAVARTIYYGAIPPTPEIESTIIAGEFDYDDETETVGGTEEQAKR
jgi:hypothetical protein